MKAWLLFLVFVFLAPLVVGEVECSRVYVANFNYDGGIITYKDKVMKCGYFPDRKLQPDEGYEAQIISMNDEVLYSFRFEVPLKVNIDLSDPIVKSLSGGILILNETDFALIFPYYDKARSIVIYNPRQYRVLEVPLIEEQFAQGRSFWWILILTLLLIIGYVAYRHYRNKKRLPA